MPHASFRIAPGVNFNRTPTLNEAGVSYSNLIRFMYDDKGLGLVQKLGGWSKFYPNTIDSTVRALLAWQTLNNIEYLAIGAESSLNVLKNGNLRNITAQAILVDPPIDLSTTNGSAVVIIKDHKSAIDDYDAVYIETQMTVGGLQLQGLYATTAAGSNTYSIIARDVLGEPQLATSTVTDGGSGPVFSTTSGTFTVSVELLAHTYAVGDTATFLLPTTVGGVTVFGNYTVNTVPDVDHFEINVDALATSTETLPLNAGYARYRYWHGIGPVSGGTGFGIGGFGSGGFGSGSTPTTNRTLDTIGAMGDGTTATISHSTNMAVPVGTNVAVAGMTPSGYNGSYTVISSTGYLFNVLSASGDGTHATLTHDGATAIEVGTTIIVAGLSVGGYNGNKVVTASTASTVSYLSATTGSIVGTGSVASNTIKVASTTTGPQTVSGTITLSNVTGVTATDYSLQNWGEFLISCPAGGGIFEWLPSSGSPVADIITQAPVANDGMFIAMPQRQIIAWQSTFTGIQDPLLLRWCDVDDYGTWIGTETNQAGSYRIPNGSKIVGCIQGPQQGLVLTDIGVWAMQYVGQPLVYSFNELGSGCGLIGRRAVGSLNNVIYWMGPSQFYRLGPNGPEDIPCPIWDVVFQQVDTAHADKIRIAPNSTFGEITWYFPTLTSNGEVAMYVKYNQLLNVWDYGNLGRTAWINQSILGPPIGADPNRYIYQHEVSPDADGAAMDSYFTTGFMEIADGDMQWFVDQFWPDMKWGYYAGNQSANLIITYYACDYAGQTPRVYGPYTFSQATTFLTPRLRGRLFAMKVESTDVGTWWRIGNSRYRYAPAGKY